jgi:ribosomal protein L18
MSINQKHKKITHQRRYRKLVSGTAEQPRMSVLEVTKRFMLNHNDETGIHLVLPLQETKN